MQTRSLFLAYMILTFFAPAIPAAAQTKAPKPVNTRTPASTAPSTRLEKLEATVKARPDNIQAREDLATELLKVKNYKRVVEILNPYTDLVSEMALLDLASAYHETKQHVDEIRILNSLLIKDPKNSDLNFLLGHAQLALAKNADPITKTAEEAKGINYFRKSIETNPRYKPAYDALLTMFVTNDNRYEARGIINDMLKRFGNRPELLNELCRLYSIDGFIDQAIQTCKQAIQVSPSYAKNFVYLATTYKDKDEPERAGQMFSNATQRFPKSAFLLVAAGDFYQSQKNHPVAVRYFQRAVAIDPKISEAQIGLARSLTDLARHQDALPHYIEACKLDSQTLPEFQEALVRVRQSSAANDLETKYSRAMYNCKQ